MNITVTLSAEEASYLKARLQNHESEEPEDPQHNRCREAIWNKIPAMQTMEQVKAFEARYHLNQDENGRDVEAW